jgi:large subunit ribosomal protein L4e
MSRPTVSVYSATEDKVVGTSPLPAVFTAPIRNDVVQFVHTNMAKNSRQAYAVNRLSGMKHSAHSWGTGRAVARIPRVQASGTSAGAMAAFGNQCRNGRMFAPTKTYRRWHRRINLHQKRYAVCSALAASALPSMLMARGHKVENIAEVPLVVEDAIQAYSKTKDAMAFLSATKALDDVERVAASRHVRAGRGKLRNRRYVARRGPMLVLPDNKGTQAFRNIFGLDLANVNALNLLALAPGGHLGRFIIWTKAAFEKLDSIFGTFTQESAVKKGFVLPAKMLTSADVTRIMQSEEVRRALKPKKVAPKKPSRYTKPSNGMKNRRLRLALNPFEKKRARAAGQLRKAGSAKVRRAAKNVRLNKAKKGVKKMVAHNAGKKGGAKPAGKKTAKK